jgi:hypothetical protein
LNEKCRLQFHSQSIKPVDVSHSGVSMRFRVTIFWTAPSVDDDEKGYGMHNSADRKVWTMFGRQRAYQKELRDVIEGDRLVYVPPVSILNAIDFETLGEPEVCLVSASKRLMKWSCFYKASMVQENINCANFPHDSHELIISLGILKHRSSRKRWDRRKWRLGLATENETRDDIRVPHGLIVDHVRVPGFMFDQNGLRFDIVPMEFGGEREDMLPDECLQVKIEVHRNSSYCDRNIVPLLTFLNVVAVSTLAMEAKGFGNRGQMTLAAAFVEIGIRMTLDSRLPVVGYQIKMQVVLNNFFYGLLIIVLESSFVYTLDRYRFGWATHWVDWISGLLILFHLSLTRSYYYTGKLPTVFGIPLIFTGVDYWSDSMIHRS